MGPSASKARSAEPSRRSASQSGLRMPGSGSCEPTARAAAVLIEDLEGMPGSTGGIWESSIKLSQQCGTSVSFLHYFPCIRCIRQAQFSANRLRKELNYSALESLAAE